MTKLPSRRTDDRLAIPATRTDGVPEEPALGLEQFAALLRQSVWFMLACSLVAAGAAAVYVERLTPVYEARVSLRIQDREPNLPDIFRTLSSAGGLNTEMEVLSSRTLVEDVTKDLALQVQIASPAGSARDTMLQDIQVSPGTKAGTYRLARQPDGGFDVTDDASGKRLAGARPGELLTLRGATFRLAGPTERMKEIKIRVQSFRDAVLQAQRALAVSRVGREADVLAIQFQDGDPDLVWRVPNAVVQHFMKRREETQKLQAASQVRFLRGQIDTLAVQLRKSEEELKRFRESARVVNPGEEASKQIGRLVELESGRSTIEAERSSLARLLAQVDSERAASGSSPQSPYRRLFASPSLFQSQAASQMISALTQVEDQRVALLTRRTEQDPEVQRLTARMAELEGQLGSIARTYLQGLTDQVDSRDSSIARFSRELGTLPGKELEYARLERTPTVLKDMYALLQTRLKEAEIAEAAENSNVAIVDLAIPPREPISSRPRLIILAALIGGLLIGLGIGVVRQFLDHTVRTRAERHGRERTAGPGTHSTHLAKRSEGGAHREPQSGAAAPRGAARVRHAGPPTPHTSTRGRATVVHLPAAGGIAGRAGAGAPGAGGTGCIVGGNQRSTREPHDHIRPRKRDCGGLLHPPDQCRVLERRRVREDSGSHECAAGGGKDHHRGQSRARTRRAWPLGLAGGRRHAPRTGTPASQPHPGARAVRGPPGCRDVRTGAPSRPGGRVSGAGSAHRRKSNGQSSGPCRVASHGSAARATEGDL